MNNNNSKTNTRITTIRMPETKYELLEKLAKENNRSLSQQINQIIDDWLKIKNN